MNGNACNGTGPANGPDQVLPANNITTVEADGTVQLQLTKDGACSDKPISVHTMFKKTVNSYPDQLALAVKRNGTWKYWNFKQYFDDSITVAKAYIKLGLERLHGVCIIGFNAPEWSIANYAAIFAGGISAGVYTTNSPDACQHLANNCEAQILVAENAAMVKKFLAVKEKLPHLKKIIQWSGKPESPDVMTWEDLMKIGQAETDVQLNKRLSLAAVNQCCTLIYTSGTTGPPKGVMCSQDHISWGATQYLKSANLRMCEEVYLSYLPLSHLAGQMMDVYMPVVAASSVYFAQPDALKGSLATTLREVRPTCFLGVPRVWEKFYEKMKEVGASTTGFKKTIATWAKYHGLNYNKAIIEGRSLGLFERMNHYLAKTIVLNKVKEALGLDRSHYLVSGAAPISTEILEYFMSLDLPIMEGYGMSENLSFCSFTFMETGRIRLGSVGKVVAQTTVKIDESVGDKPGEGEICMKGRNVFMGYLRMQDKTNETVDSDGWLHSGDIGKFDSDGYLYITGRLKELVITAGGENIPPVLIEEAVKHEIPAISNCVLIGDKRKYLTMLITFKSEVDIETGEPKQNLTRTCVEWLRKQGSEVSTVEEAQADVAKFPNGPLATAINQGIVRYNKNAASNAQKVQKWKILPNDFSIPTKELNNTLKVKRFFVHSKYADIIDEMYA